MTKKSDLIAYLLDGQTYGLAGDLQRWMEASSRFTAFLDTYRDKIRKKIRVAREPESVLDLRGELDVARCLLLDRRLDVAYEPYASAKSRGPDFAVTYRANLTFNVEVTRVHASEAELVGSDLQHSEERLGRILLSKLGQMKPGRANLLVICAPEEWAQFVDLRRFTQKLKTRIDRKDPDFGGASPYASVAAFYRDFLRLTGILLWAAGAKPWVNKQARPGLPERVLRLVGSLSSGTSSAR